MIFLSHRVHSVSYTEMISILDAERITPYAEMQDMDETWNTN